MPGTITPQQSAQIASFEEQYSEIFNALEQVHPRGADDNPAVFRADQIAGQIPALASSVLAFDESVANDPNFRPPEDLSRAVAGTQFTALGQIRSNVDVIVNGIPNEVQTNEQFIASNLPVDATHVVANYEFAVSAAIGQLYELAPGVARSSPETVVVQVDTSAPPPAEVVSVNPDNSLTIPAEVVESEQPPTIPDSGPFPVITAPVPPPFAVQIPGPNVPSAAADAITRDTLPVPGRAGDDAQKISVDLAKIGNDVIQFIHNPLVTTTIGADVQTLFKDAGEAGGAAGGKALGAAIGAGIGVAIADAVTTAAFLLPPPFDALGFVALSFDKEIIRTTTGAFSFVGGKAFGAVGGSIGESIGSVGRDVANAVFPGPTPLPLGAADLTPIGSIV